MPMQKGPEDFMRAAIDAAFAGMRKGEGGPFGAVIVRGGEVIASGCNRVTSSHDPTAHAEVVAIRAAAQALGTHSLAGCTIYASCEPCPMCLAAIYWARLDRLFFACTRADAAAAGFDDEVFYQELAKPLDERSVPTALLLRDEAWTVMREWIARSDKTPY